MTAGARLTTMPKLLLTPEEAADVLSIGRSKLYELLRDGVIRSVRIGSCRRIPASVLADYLSELETAGPTWAR